MLWQLGTPNMKRLGLSSAVNCWVVDVLEPADFAWMAEMLMLGGGVGFKSSDPYGFGTITQTRVSVTSEADCDYIVSDNRQGWGELIRRVVAAYCDPLCLEFTFNVDHVRREGESIKTFGGKASGPEILVKGVTEISGVLDAAVGRHLTEVDILDIGNIIGSIVVAGNVRRCLPAGTLVNTPLGARRIESLTPGDTVSTVYGDAVVNAVFDQGRQELVVIHHQYGDLKCTPNHRVAVFTAINEWTYKRADELVPGDRLVWDFSGYDGTEQNLPGELEEKPTQDHTSHDVVLPELNEDIAWLIGLVHGDGYVFVPSGKTPNGMITIACPPGWEEIPERAEEAFRQFGVQIRINTTQFDRAIRVSANSTRLAKWFYEHVKQPNTPIQVPDWIMNAPRTIRSAYLAGIMDADGAPKNRPKVVASTVYESYADQLVYLGSTLGIPLRKHLNRPARDNWQNLYHVTIVGHDALRMFDEQVGEFSTRWTSPTSLRSSCGMTFSTSMVRKTHNKVWVTSPTVSTQRVRTYGQTDLIALPVTVIGVEHTKETAQTWDIEVDQVHTFTVGGLVVHNSALLFIGSPESDYLAAKRWDLGVIPHWRAMSNNSVDIVDVRELPEVFWEGYKGNGEPYGLVNLTTARSYGRSKDLMPDPGVVGFNPCAEIVLSDKEPCVLSEVFLPNITTYSEFVDVSKLLYKIQKAVTSLPALHRSTHEIVSKNMRLGLGVGGVVESQDKWEWLSPGYEELRRFDKEWSASRGWPESIRLTTSKPSGTISLLAGVSTPGSNAGFAPYFIRRVRMSTSDPLVKFCVDRGHHCEFVARLDGSHDDRTVVIEFPCKSPETARFAAQMSACEQMDVIRMVQREWADNAVSVTVYYRPEELDDIRNYLRQHWHTMKSVSFLLHQEHGFAQAPLEEISQSRYQAETARLGPFQVGSIGGIVSDLLDDECAGGACPIR